MFALQALALFTSAVAAASIVATDDVPLLGPAFLSHFDSSNSTAIRDAKAAFPGVIDSLFTTGALNKTDLVFSIDVFSTATNGSIYSYFHVGEGQNETLTSGKLDEKTVGRLGSVTKLFTVYALLAKGGIEILSHPVTRYIPEFLANSTSDPTKRIPWKDITVGALASHQGGVGGPGEFFLEHQEDFDKITSEDLVLFLRDQQHPVTSPFRTAVYSDAGFGILTLVLERLSGLSYEDALEEILFRPLGLHSTSTLVPTGSDVNAINRLRVDNTSSWETRNIPFLGSGGLYSNLEDLRITGLSILNSELLSPFATQAWMKPLSGTGSLVELVGAPWEIARLMIPATPGSNRTRICDIYTKAGGTGDYTSIIALDPDHGLGYSILVAGATASSARWPIRQAIAEVFVPAAELAAAENARTNLVGVFVDPNSENTNLTITFDKGKPGLGLESFYMEGVESRALLIGAAEPVDISARLYPTGINSISASLASLYMFKGNVSVAHRMVSSLPTPRAAVEGGSGGLFDNTLSWMSIGFTGSYDEFILNLVDGKLVSVRSSGFGVTLERSG